MQIKDKLFMDHNALHEYGPITIVAFGDSVTHGALTGGEYHFDTVYWNLLRKRLFEIRNDIPVNVINADFQGCGKMDLYIESAMKLANDNGVTVCDCYNEWKKLSKTKDTTLLLCNRMNHPCKEMHTLFADMLFDIIAKDIPRQKKTEK